MGSTTAPTWLVLLAPVAAIVAAAIGAWTSRIGWRAERSREHQRWVREQRVDAYLGFLDTSNDMLWVSRARRLEDPSWRPDVEWLEPLDKSLLRVKLFGSPTVAMQATSALDAFAQGAAVSTDDDPQTASAELKVLQQLVQLVRHDLNVETSH